MSLLRQLYRSFQPILVIAFAFTLAAITFGLAGMRPVRATGSGEIQAIQHPQSGLSNPLALISTATPTPTPGGGTPPAGTRINIQNFAFSPNDITVSVGTTIVWVNLDLANHQPVSDTGVWTSPVLTQNQWFTFTFTTVGVYTYHCAIHPMMLATIRVVNPTNTPTSTPTTTPIPPRVDSIGIYRAGTFYLRLHNSTGVADLTVAFNPASQAIPIVGDWTGAGFDTVGVFDQSNGLFTLCTVNVTANCANVANQKSLVLGVPNDSPLSGRWTVSSANAGVGVFRPSNGLIYLKNVLTSGFADYTMVLGIPSDQGLTGDWNSKGFDSPGVYRPSNSTFYLSNKVINGSVIGDYQFAYGIGGDAPVTGDWIAQGHDGVGLFRQSNGLTYLKNQLVTGFADNTFTYGIAGDIPVAGHWQLIYPPVAPVPVLVPTTVTPPANSSVPGDMPIGD